MTRPIYEPSYARTDAKLGFGEDQLFRRPGTQPGQYPICFRAKMTPITDAETNTYHFISGDEGQNVFWNSWDPDFDTSVYDISDYEENDFGYDVIAGVGLLALGIYSIHATLDFQTYTNITSLTRSNWDEGMATFMVTNNIGDGGEPYYGDAYNFRVDHWRQVVEIPPPDHLWGGEATTVEIVFSFSGETAMPGVTSGVWDGAAPDPAGELWIPGGYEGAWGLVPNLLVMYWGPVIGLDPDWPSEGLPP